MPHTCPPRSPSPQHLLHVVCSSGLQFSVSLLIIASHHTSDTTLRHFATNVEAQQVSTAFPMWPLLSLGLWARERRFHLAHTLSTAQTQTHPRPLIPSLRPASAEGRAPARRYEQAASPPAPGQWPKSRDHRHATPRRTKARRRRCARRGKCCTVAPRGWPEVGRSQNHVVRRA